MLQHNHSYVFINSRLSCHHFRFSFLGEGGGAEGIFVGDGKTLNSVAAVGDPLTGGAAILILLSRISHLAAGSLTLLLIRPEAETTGSKPPMPAD